jgi:hypothetical protein
MLISSLGAILSFAIALATTPTLQKDVADGLDENFLHGDFSERASIALSFSMLIFNIIIEYIYVIKSRIILKKIRKNMKLVRIISVYLADVLSTFVLFLTLTPAIVSVCITLFSYIYQIGGTVEEASGVRITRNGVATTYLWVFEELKYDMIHGVETGFREYQSMNFALYRFHDRKTLNNKNCDSDGCVLPISVDVQFVTYFTSTALASAYATTAWISIYAVMILIGNILCQNFRLVRSLLLWVHDDPSVILIGLPLCVPACLMSGMVIVWLFRLS